MSATVAPFDWFFEENQSGTAWNGIALPPHSPHLCRRDSGTNSSSRPSRCQSLSTVESCPVSHLHHLLNAVLTLTHVCSVHLVASFLSATPQLQGRRRTGLLELKRGRG